MPFQRQLKEKAVELMLRNEFDRMNVFQGKDNCADPIQMDKLALFRVPNLHRAVFNGNITLVRRLIAEGENVNLTIKDGPKMLKSEDKSPKKWFGFFTRATPLIVACQTGNLKIVKLLVEKGAHINMSDSVGLTPFAVACSENYIDICKFLYSHRALCDIREDRFGMTPLLIACRKNHCDIARWLVSKGSNVNVSDINGRSSLHYACWNYNTLLIKFLVNKGAKINARDKEGNTPLHLLVSLDDLEPNDFGILSSANEAVICQEILDLLSSKSEFPIKVDINRKVTRGREDQDLATSADPWYSLAEIIKLGADQDLQNYRGQTPLHILASNLPEASLSMRYAIIFEPKFNQTLLVQLCILLKLNAEIDNSDSAGRTPTDICQQQNNWIGVKILNKYTNSTNVHINLEDVDHIQYIAKRFGTKYLQNADELERHLEEMSDLVIEPTNARSFFHRSRDTILDIWNYIDRHVNGN